MGCYAFGDYITADLSILILIQHSNRMIIALLCANAGQSVLGYFSGLLAQWFFARSTQTFSSWTERLSKNIEGIQDD